MTSGSGIGRSISRLGWEVIRKIYLFGDLHTILHYEALHGDCIDDDDDDNSLLVYL